MRGLIAIEIAKFEIPQLNMLYAHDDDRKSTSRRSTQGDLFQHSDACYEMKNK